MLGLTSSFFLISSALPPSVTEPVVEYLTTFGFVEIASVKFSVTWLVSFFCSSIFALTSKNNSFFVEYSPVRSPCRLCNVMETVTPETEYCGLTADSSLHIISVILIFNCCIKLTR